MNSSGPLRNTGRTVSAWAFSTALLGLAVGCSSATPRDAERPGVPEWQVTLDANVHDVVPGRPVKFFVDVVNCGHETQELDKLAIEMTVSPQGNPSEICLRRTWDYSYAQTIRLLPGKRLTTSIAPKGENWQEIHSGDTMTVSEFALAQLRAGKYEIRATVNDTYTSPPYSVEVHRADIRRAEDHFFGRRLRSAILQSRRDAGSTESP